MGRIKVEVNTMMYNNKLVCSIKSNGKILREFKDIIYLKYDSEYSLLLKNLHTTKALVNIYIDGECVTLNGLILSPSEEVEFERSLSNHNLNQGNKFKFIEMTDSIESHRGVKIEDGIIRVEFSFERAVTYIPTIQPTWIRGCSYETAYSAAIGGVTNDGAIAVNNLNTSGITVPGSKSDQKFNYGHIGPLESEKHSIVFRLMGKTKESTVTKTVTVKSKPRCVTCNRLNKSGSSYCSNCGTSLVLY